MFKLLSRDGIRLLALLFPLLLPQSLIAAEWNIISHFPAAPDEDSQRRALAANDSRFFCYGGVPEISYSDDGVFWSVMTTATSHLTVNFEEVVYLDGRFVAVDGSENVLYSSNGFDWQSINLDNAATPETESYLDITFCDLQGQEQFLAVGPNGAIAFSTDADPSKPWSFHHQIPEKPDLHLAAWGNARQNSAGNGPLYESTWFIAGRDRTNSHPAIYYLREGGSWLPVPSDADDPFENSPDDYEFTDVFFDPSQPNFYIAATRVSPTDSPTLQAGYFISKNGEFLDGFFPHSAVEGDESRAGKFQLIEDELHLQAHTIVYEDDWRSAFYRFSNPNRGGYGYFHMIETEVPRNYDFAVLDDNFLYLIDGNRIELETPSHFYGNATRLDSPNQYHQFYSFGGWPLLMHLGYASGFISQNGIDWGTYQFRRDSSRSLVLRALQTYNGHIYGSDGDEIWRSTDLADWERLPVDTPASRPPATMAVHKDILLLGYENGRILLTRDGENWTESTVPIDFHWGTYNSLRSTNDGFLYVYSGEIWTSPEGQHWTQIVDRQTGEEHFVAYGNHRVVLATKFATYVYNFKTKTWAYAPLPEDSAIPVYVSEHFHYANGRFFLCTGLNVWSSLNGVDWEQIASTPPDMNLPETRPALTYYQQQVIMRYPPATLASFPYAPDRLADWKKLHTLTDSPDDEDGDGDGLTLLEEYARGKNPHHPDAPENTVAIQYLDPYETPELGTVTLTTEPEKEPYLTLTFDVRTDDPKLSYQVQEVKNIDDADSWQNGGVQVGYAQPLGPGLQRVTYRSTHRIHNFPNAYMRVKITRSAE